MFNSLIKQYNFIYHKKQNLLNNRLSYFFLILLMISFLHSLGQIISNICLPSFPCIAKNFSVPTKYVKLSSAVYMFSFGISQIVNGFFSDKFGRRTIVTLSLIIATFGSIICIISKTFILFCLARVIQGIGIGACSTISKAIQRDIFKEENLSKFASYNGIITGIIFIFIPLTGGYISHLTGSWEANFILSSILLIISALMLWFFLPETNNYVQQNSISKLKIKHSIILIIKNLDFLWYSCLNLSSCMAITAYANSAPFILQTQMSFNILNFAWISALNSLFIILGRITSAKLISQCGIHQVILYGIICKIFGTCCLVINLLFFPTSSLIFITSVNFLSFGLGLIFSNSFAGAMSPFDKSAGLASGLFVIFQMIGGITGTIIISVLSESQQQLSLLIVFVIASIISSIAYYKIYPSQLNLMNISKKIRV